MAMFTETELKNWLSNPTDIMLQSKDKYESRFLFKISINDDFDMLYQQRNYNGANIEIGGELEYAGIHHKQDGCIYIASYNLRHCCEKTPIIKEQGMNDIKEELSELVRAKVDDFIDNDKSKLSIKKLATEEWQYNVAQFAEYRAADEAKRMFLKSKGTPEIRFHCMYELSSATDETYLDFIKDKDALAEHIANEYIERHQEEMLAQFIKNAFLQKELDKITDNPDDVLHRIKAIIESVKESGAKTVNVTINKDGQEFSFKYEADRLTYAPDSYYSTYHIKATDRREFENRFGRSADFHPEEITQITYGRNVLYDSSEFDMSETEDTAFEQSM